MALSKSFIPRTQYILTTHLGNKTNFINYCKVRTFNEYSNSVYHVKNLFKEQKCNDKISNIFLLKKHNLKCFSKYNFFNDKSISKAIGTLFHLKGNVKNLYFLRNQYCVKSLYTLCNQGCVNDLCHLYNRNKKNISYKNTQEDRLNDNEGLNTVNTDNKNNSDDNENNPVKSIKQTNELKLCASDWPKEVATDKNIKCENELPANINCDKGSITKIPEEILEKKINISQIKNIQPLQLAEKIKANEKLSILSLPETEIAPEITEDLLKLTNENESGENKAKPSDKDEEEDSFIRIEDFLKNTDFLVDKNKVISYYRKSTEEMMRNYYDGTEDYFKNLPEVLPHFIMKENISEDKHQQSLSGAPTVDNINVPPSSDSKNSKSATEIKPVIKNNDIKNETKSCAGNNECQEKIESKGLRVDDYKNNSDEKFKENIKSDVTNKNNIQTSFEQTSMINSKGSYLDATDKKYSEVINDLKTNQNSQNQIVMANNASSGARLPDGKTYISCGLTTKVQSSKYHSDSKNDRWIPSYSEKIDKQNRSRSNDNNNHEDSHSNNQSVINYNKLNAGDKTKRISITSESNEINNVIVTPVCHFNNIKEFANIQNRNSVEQETFLNNVNSNSLKTTSDTGRSTETNQVNLEFEVAEINATNYRLVYKKQINFTPIFKPITKHSCINNDENVKKNSLNFTNGKQSLKSKRRNKIDNASNSLLSLRKEMCKKKRKKRNSVEKFNDIKIRKNEMNQTITSYNNRKGKKINNKLLNDDENKHLKKCINIFLDKNENKLKNNNDNESKSIEFKINQTKTTTSPAININLNSKQAKFSFDELTGDPTTNSPQSKLAPEKCKESLSSPNLKSKLCTDVFKASLTSHSPKSVLKVLKTEDSLIASSPSTKELVDKSEDLMKLPTKDAASNIKCDSSKSYIFEELNEINSDLSDLVLDVKRFWAKSDVDKKLNYRNSPPYIYPTINNVFGCSKLIDEYNFFDNLDNELFVLTKTDKFVNLHALTKSAEDQIKTTFGDDLQNEPYDVFGNNIEVTESSVTLNDDIILLNSDNEIFILNPLIENKIRSANNSLCFLESSLLEKSEDCDKHVQPPEFKTTGKDENKNIRIMKQIEENSSSKSLRNKLLKSSEEKLDDEVNDLHSPTSGKEIHKTTTDALRAFEDFYLRKSRIDENICSDSATHSKVTDKLSNQSDKINKIEHYSAKSGFQNTQDEAAGNNNNNKSKSFFKSNESGSNFEFSKKAESITPIEYFISREIPIYDKENLTNPFHDVNHTISNEAFSSAKEPTKTKFRLQSKIPKPTKQQLSVSPAELQKFYNKKNKELLWQPRKDYDQNSIKKFYAEEINENYLNNNELRSHVRPTSPENQAKEAVTSLDKNEIADESIRSLNNFETVQDSASNEKITHENNEKSNKTLYENCNNKLDEMLSNMNTILNSVKSNHSLPTKNSIDGLTDRYFDVNEQNIEQMKSNSQTGIDSNEDDMIDQCQFLQGDSYNQNDYHSNENSGEECITEREESNDHKLKGEKKVSEDDGKFSSFSLRKKNSDETINNFKTTKNSCDFGYSKEHSKDKINSKDHVNNGLLVTQNNTNVSKPEEYTDTTLTRLTKTIDNDDNKIKDIAEIQSLMKLLSEFYDCQKGEPSSITDDLLMLGKKYKEVIEKEEKQAKSDDQSEEDFWDIDSIITNCMVEASTGCVVQDYSLDLIDSKTRLKLMEEIFESEQFLKIEEIQTDQSNGSPENTLLNKEFFGNFNNMEENINYKIINEEVQITKYLNNIELSRVEESQDCKTFDMSSMMSDNSNKNYVNESSPDILDSKPEVYLKQPETAVKNNTISGENPNTKQHYKNTVHKSNDTISGNNENSNMQNINFQRPFSTFSQPSKAPIIKDKKEENTVGQNVDATKRINDFEGVPFQRKLSTQNATKTTNLRMKKESHNPKKLIEREIEKMKESVNHIKCLNHPLENVDLMSRKNYLKSQIHKSKITEENLHKSKCTERKTNVVGNLKTVGSAKAENQYVMYPLMVNENSSKRITKQDVFFCNSRKFSSKPNDESITNKGIEPSSKTNKQGTLSNKSTPPSCQKITKENSKVVNETTSMTDKPASSGSEMLRILQNALIKKIKEKVQRLEVNQTSEQNIIKKKHTIPATNSSFGSFCNIINVKQNMDAQAIPTEKNYSQSGNKNIRKDKNLLTVKNETEKLQKGMVNSQCSDKVLTSQDKKNVKSQLKEKDHRGSVTGNKTMGSSEKNNNSLPTKLIQTFSDELKNKDLNYKTNKQPVFSQKHKQTASKKENILTEKERDFKTGLLLQGISKNFDQSKKSSLEKIISGKTNIPLDNFMNVTKTVINYVPIKGSSSKEKTHVFSDLIYGNSTKKHQPISKTEPKIEHIAKHFKDVSPETHRLQKMADPNFKKITKTTTQNKLVKKSGAYSQHGDVTSTTQNIGNVNKTMKQDSYDETNDYSDIFDNPARNAKKTVNVKKLVENKEKKVKDKTMLKDIRKEILSSTKNLTHMSLNSSREPSKKHYDSQVCTKKTNVAEEKVLNEIEEIEEIEMAVSSKCDKKTKISSQIKNDTMNFIPELPKIKPRNEQLSERSDEGEGKKKTVLLFSSQELKANQSVAVPDADQKTSQHPKHNTTTSNVTSHLFSSVQDVELDENTKSNQRQKANKENKFQDHSQNVPKPKKDSMDDKSHKHLVFTEEDEKPFDKSDATDPDIKATSTKPSNDSSSSNIIFEQSEGSAKSTGDLQQEDVLLGRIKYIKNKKGKRNDVKGLKQMKKERSKSLSCMTPMTSDSSHESVNKLSILKRLNDLRESGDFVPDFSEYIQFFSRSENLNFLNDCNFSFVNQAKINAEYPIGKNMYIPKHDTAFIQKIFMHLPSVSTVLNNTLPVSSKSALKKWKTKVMNEVGVTGFEKLREDRLHNDVQFHECIQRHLTGTPLEELFETATPVVKKCLLSLKSTFPNLTDVTLLEAHVVHAHLPYHGIVDCVALYDHHPVLIEWKQADSRMSLLRFTYDAPVQLAAYLGAFNHDKMYKFPVKTGLIIVAYTDGSPADTFPLSNDDCHRYWRVWLSRLASYLDLKKID